MSTDFEFVEQIPSAADYRRLRTAVGWANLNDLVEAGLANSLFSICVLQGGQVVACGRVIGDGAIYFYIQDIIVLPQFQAMGLGRGIMDRVMQYIRSHAVENSFIGLMAAKDVAGFYERYGFQKRPVDRPGMYMMWRA